MSQIQMHEEDLVSLVARASARSQFPDLEFSDPWAEEVLAKLVPDTRVFDERRLRASATRTMAMDGLVRHFFWRHPDGLAIALYPGLCTRFSRVDNGRLRWIDLEPPCVARAKCEIFRTPDRHVVAACCSLTCTGWMGMLGRATDVPTLVVAEGILFRRPEAEFDEFLTGAVQRFASGTELVVDYDARRPLRPSSLRRAGACLEMPLGDGAISRYPRLKYVPADEYPRSLERELAGLNGVSRLFRGLGIPSVAHLRFA